MAFSQMMAIILGPLLLAGAIIEARALQPVSDALGKERPAVEKEQWPWTSAGRLWNKMQQKLSNDPNIHDGLPPTPGCWMRMASGCPRQPMKTFAWRRDTWADQRGTDDAGCHERKSVWDKFCGAEDAEMLYVSGRAEAPPAPAAEALPSRNYLDRADAEPPRAPSESPPAPVRADAVVDSDSDVPMIPSPRAASGPDSDVLSGYPTEPGCYLRTPTGCPAKPMKTHMWRHDAWAEQHELNEAGCKERKHVWDTYCGVDDVKVLFVPRQ
jgi:hypothetical protein